MVLTDLIWTLVPPEVALRIAQAASFLVLYSAPELSRSLSIGKMLQSITACSLANRIGLKYLSSCPGQIAELSSIVLQKPPNHSSSKWANLLC